MRPLGREVVTVVRAQLVENTRDESLYRDWANATETDYSGCSVQPFILSEKFQAEDTTDREFLRYTLRVWGPPNMDVEYTDKVVWRGKEYEVSSLDGVWSHIMGPDHHIAFTVRERIG